MWLDDDGKVVIQAETWVPGDAKPRRALVCRLATGERLAPLAIQVGGRWFQLSSRILGGLGYVEA